MAPGKPSRLPWAIALVAIGAAAGVAVVLYIELGEMKDKPKPMTTNDPIVMMKSDPKPAPPVVAAVASGAETKVTPSVPSPKVEEPAETVETVPAPAPAKIAAPKVEPKRVEPKKLEPKPVEPKKASAPVEPKKVETKLELKKVNAAPKPEPKKVEPPQPPPVKGPPGSIQIDANPYAVIFIDGKKIGETPLVTKLAPGKHTVRAVSPSGATRTSTITIESGKTAPVHRIEW